MDYRAIPLSLYFCGSEWGDAEGPSFCITLVHEFASNVYVTARTEVISLCCWPSPYLVLGSLEKTALVALA